MAYLLDEIHSTPSGWVRQLESRPSGFTAETDWLLEESGFEPSVPLGEKRSFRNASIRELHRAAYRGGRKRYRREGIRRHVRRSLARGKHRAFPNTPATNDRSISPPLLYGAVDHLPSPSRKNNPTLANSGLSVSHPGTDI